MHEAVRIMVFSFIGAALYDIMEHSGKTAWRIVAKWIDDWRVHRKFERDVKTTRAMLESGAWSPNQAREHLQARDFYEIEPGRCIR